MSKILSRPDAATGIGTSSSHYYEFVVESLPVAVVTVDPELRITGFNAWAEHVTGYTKEEALGRFCGEVLQGDRCHNHCPLRTVLDHEHQILRLETTVRSKHGEVVPVRMNTAGLFDSDGVLVGGLEAFQDVSELKKAERGKENLISMFAHDMKSSVVIMGGFARRLLAKVGDADTESRKRHLEIIVKEAQKLESFLYEFLEFSRLETGELRLNPSATYLPKELLEIKEEHELRAAKAGVKVVLESEADLPVIQADARRLGRVFSNLLDNAIKYSSAGTSVVISVEDLGSELAVRVKDQGQGIDPEELPYVFDPFHRARGAETREGFGLGLATVKAIVEAHAGRLLVESEPGKGSTFTVILPKAGAGSGALSPRRRASEA